jgi:NurA domain-containing protein
MPNFIDRLSEQVESKKAELRETLTYQARPEERDLQQLVKKHWHRLPKSNQTPKLTAYAVDGSNARRDLSNGAYLLVAQALMVGEYDGHLVEDSQVDVRILPGATRGSFADRFAQLMMHCLEVNLACEHLGDVPKDAVIFFDGSLYGQLPQLFPVQSDAENTEDSNANNEITESINEVVAKVLKAYRVLFQASQDRLAIISVAKTSRDTIHPKAWWKAEFKKEMPSKGEISTIEALFRWTNRSAGYSTPILFGKRAFSKQPERAVLSNVKDGPAILSFFVRLADFDDALRIDVPACCVGRDETIDDIEFGEEILLDQPADLDAVNKILQLLLSDYGGPDVYNALMYSVDREVRLRQDMMDQVYLSLIQNTLGGDIELRLDRSERRFHGR